MDTDIPTFPQLTYAACVELGYTLLDTSRTEFEYDVAMCIAKFTRSPYPQMSQQDRDCIALMSMEKYFMLGFLALAVWLAWRTPKTKSE